jgi:ribosomal protein S18 acetylase RimI-like enzyme
MTNREQEMPDLEFRRATRCDVRRIVELLVDDELGKGRDRLEDPLAAAYLAAFEAIERDPNQMILLADWRGEVVGCMQLTYLPGLSNRGAWRALIESVRVVGPLRRQGIGEALVRHALGLARERGCRVAQLTTHKSRTAAHRFYRRLGFEPTHEGMKLVL